MSEYIKRKIEASKTNPFVLQLATTITTRGKIQAVGRSSSIINLETGELTDQEVMQVRKEPVDKEEFVKIFAGGLSAMFDLNKPAQQMFKIVLSAYLGQKNQPEQIYLNQDVLEEYGYNKGRTARNNALNILVQNLFLAPVANRQHFYWTNPNMFFKGNRLTIVKQYAIRGTVEGDLMERQIKEETAHQNQLKLV